MLSVLVKRLRRRHGRARPVAAAAEGPRRRRRERPSSAASTGSLGAPQGRDRVHAPAFGSPPGRFSRLGLRLVGYVFDAYGAFVAGTG